MPYIYTLIKRGECRYSDKCKRIVRAVVVVVAVVVVLVVVASFLNIN